MNDMRKLMNLTENTYADEANKHIEGLAEVIANYLISVSDDPYLYSDISEFSGGTLEVRVTELIQAKSKGLGEAGYGKDDDLSRKKCESCDGEGETGIEGWKETCLSCAGSGYND